MLSPSTGPRVGPLNVSPLPPSKPTGIMISTVMIVNTIKLNELGGERVVEKEGKGQR